MEQEVTNLSMHLLTDAARQNVSVSITADRALELKDIRAALATYINSIDAALKGIADDSKEK